MCYFKIKPVDFIKEFLPFKLNYYDKDESNSIVLNDDMYINNQVHVIKEVLFYTYPDTSIEIDVDNNIADIILIHEDNKHYIKCSINDKGINKLKEISMLYENSNEKKKISTYIHKIFTYACIIYSLPIFLVLEFLKLVKWIKFEKYGESRKDSLNYSLALVIVSSLIYFKLIWLPVAMLFGLGKYP